MTIDLLVLGGGMAGLTAAARAAEQGAEVLVAEKAAAPGGSAVMAEFLWTAASYEALRDVEPDGEPALHARLIEGRAAALAWLGELGVEAGPEVGLLGFGTGNRIDTAALIRALRERIGAQRLALETEPVELLVEDDGRVAGAVLRGPDGERRAVRARWTLIATGGFQGDAELRAAHLPDGARDLPVRAQRVSDGRGLALGRAAGGAARLDGARFYGHLWPAGVRIDDPARFAAMTFFHSEHGLLLDRRGRRFVDETEGDHLNTIATLEDAGGRALLICDERVHREWMLRPYVQGLEPIDRFALAYRAGGRCATAADLDELACLPEEWGYDGAAVRDTVEAYNVAVEAGGVDPPRRRDPAPLDEPPYYVVEVAAAITFTFGGLAVDAGARVLRDDGAPVPGLLAAGADAGGLYVRRYAGGLAAAMAFGLAAARTTTLTTIREGAPT
jgi:succinate dehydrogenase/fumarate reductase flavoprotein subunit